MPYIYTNANHLERTEKVGGGDCVALVRHYAGAPHNSMWREGEKVLDNSKMRQGMAIATFVNGRYPNNPTGNHAAFFLRHGPKGAGFWVIDQWKNNATKRRVTARYLSVKKGVRNQDGSYSEASDNAAAFSIIE